MQSIIPSIILSFPPGSPVPAYVLSAVLLLAGVVGQSLAVYAARVAGGAR